MAGFWKLVCELVHQLATAHRPTVPPDGERTVIVIIAMAVMPADHLAILEHSAQIVVRLLASSFSVKEGPEYRGLS